MKLSEGHLAAWEVTAAILAHVDPEEREMLPDLMASVHAPAGRISEVPGAWDFDLAGVSSVAVTVFGVVVACLQSSSPKLFEAALDVGTDAAKKILGKAIDGGPVAPASSGGPDPARIHELVRVAALERRLSTATAEAIANAVVARLAMKPESAGPA